MTTAIIRNWNGPRLAGTALVTSLLALLNCPAGGQCEVEKLLPADGADHDAYGESVAIDGTVAVVGASHGDGPVAGSGTAYVLRFDGSQWVPEQKLMASDGEYFDHFGRSVAVQGEITIVGAYLDDDYGMSSGAAYFFRYDGSEWVEQQKVVASDAAMYDCFGRGLALDGDTLLIGAYGDGDHGPKSGSVYVFRLEGDSWVETEKLHASDASGGDWFGFSVAMSEGAALIGAYANSDYGTNSGAAYVFRFDGSNWVEEQKLHGFDASEHDMFGYSVAIDGEQAVIGAKGAWDLPSMMYPGAAYVFRNGDLGWQQEHRFALSSGADYYAVGASVAISGDTVLIGAPGTYGSPPGFGGAVYAGRLSGSAFWQMELIASDTEEEQHFGCAVALDDVVALIGADHDDDNGYRSGSAYVFVAGGSDCNDNLIPDECDILSGTSEDVNENGIPDECENDCPEDLNGDGKINIDDLFIMFRAWGPCE